MVAWQGIHIDDRDECCYRKWLIDCEGEKLVCFHVLIIETSREASFTEAECTQVQKEALGTECAAYSFYAHFCTRIAGCFFLSEVVSLL